MARSHASLIVASRIFGWTVQLVSVFRCRPSHCNILFISSSADIIVCFSKSIVGTGFRITFVEVLERTFGHAGAFVSSASRSSNSDGEVLLSFAAVVTLHNVIENPGPFKDVSKGPE